MVDAETRAAFRLTLACVVAITLVRCAVLVLSPLDLYPDEAQYWWWAQTPDLGYFSKPPMIAWLIWLSTSVFGNAEWAIRIFSPLLHAATSLLIFAIARRSVTARLSLLAALAYLTLPGLSWSSGLISSDVPLLFFWAAALYAFLRGCDDENWCWPLLCGLSLGLGLESKYAMLYFPAGAVAAALVSANARRLVFGPHGVAILVVGLALLSPNILWNARHGFPTIAHTEANADWGRARYNVVSAVQFALGQFGVFGPLLMAGYIAALWRLGRGASTESERLLMAFSLPPLVLILIQSFVAGANANWAATAFIAATPLAVVELARWWQGRVLGISFAINGAAMLALWLFVLRPDAADAVGVGNAFKREEGWRQLGVAVARMGGGAPYDFIVADNRSLVAELLFYARARPSPIRVWTRDLRIRDHFEMTMRLAPGARHVLLALEPEGAARVLATFDSAKRLARVSIPVGGGHSRTVDLYEARDYRGS
ncbi:MAG TPA: glycosyltransferase family 39 protein [Rhizomicrobium sp.]|jgi:4-amino-4-deoxy-L-arabinose transferase-like glycosyltransferase